MQTYKVIGHSAILGVGLILKLAQSQASTRTQKLKRKSKDIYVVLEPVQFKQGEVISVISGNVSKAVLANLEDTSKPKKQEQKTKAPAKTKAKKADDALENNEDDLVSIDQDNSNQEDLVPKAEDQIIDGSSINDLPPS